MEQAWQGYRGKDRQVAAQKSTKMDSELRPRSACAISKTSAKVTKRLSLASKYSSQPPIS